MDGLFIGLLKLQSWLMTYLMKALVKAHGVAGWGVGGVAVLAGTVKEFNPPQCMPPWLLLFLRPEFCIKCDMTYLGVLG